MNRVFFVLFGLLVFEGVTGLPTSEDDDIKISSNKKTLNARRMIHGKRHRFENREYKPNDRFENREYKPNDRFENRQYKSNDRFENRQYKSNDRFENREYTSNDRVENPEYKSNDKSTDKAVDNVIVAINSGVKTFITSENKSDIVGKLAKTLVDYVKNSQKDAVYRSKAEEYIKPGLVNFRKDKPSVMLELNSKSIINGLQDLLQSKLVRRLLQHYSKEAAVVYRSLKNQWHKPGERDANEQI